MMNQEWGANGFLLMGLVGLPWSVGTGMALSLLLPGWGCCSRLASGSPGSHVGQGTWANEGTVAVRGAGNWYLPQCHTALPLILLGFILKTPSRESIPQAQTMDSSTGHKLRKGDRALGECPPPRTTQSILFLQNSRPSNLHSLTRSQGKWLRSRSCALALGRAPGSLTVSLLFLVDRIPIDLYCQMLCGHLFWLYSSQLGIPA